MPDYYNRNYNAELGAVGVSLFLKACGTKESLLERSIRLSGNYLPDDVVFFGWYIDRHAHYEFGLPRRLARKVCAEYGKRSFMRLEGSTLAGLQQHDEIVGVRTRP